MTAFEVQIILEHCDMGTLRDTLRSGLLHPGSLPNYEVILDIAMDIAKGCLHLHTSNIIHADLKASNILLKSTTNEKKGFEAKIADFGLSIAKMDSSETHVSNMMQGTFTHMSPECLLTGQQSNAGDIYSYGITLFELYTASQAFKNIPQAFLAHKVSHDHLRPLFPPGTPSGFKALAEACWDPIASARPTFDTVVSILDKLRSGEEGFQMDDIRKSLGGSQSQFVEEDAEEALSISESDLLSQYRVDSFHAAKRGNVMFFSPVDTAPSSSQYPSVEAQTSEKTPAGLICSAASEDFVRALIQAQASETSPDPTMRGIVLTPLDESSTWRL